MFNKLDKIEENIICVKLVLNVLKILFFKFIYTLIEPLEKLLHFTFNQKIVLFASLHFSIFCDWCKITLEREIMLLYSCNEL